MTTYRSGSTPSDSLRTPSIPATASCTTLRSNGFMGASEAGSAAVNTSRATFVPSRVRSARRLSGAPPSRPHAAGDPGLLLYGEPSELLQGIQRCPVRANQLGQPITDDRHDRSVALDVHVQVPVVVHDVEQPL